MRRVHNEVDELPDLHRLNRYLNLLLGTIILVFSLGILAFGEKFLFWKHAFSYLGMVRTPKGNPNTASLLIHGSGMILSSLICFRISRVFKGNGPFGFYLFRACGLGYLLLLVPCDLCNSIHSVGGALVFGTLWLFTVRQLIDLNHRIPGYRIYIYHLVLQGTVLPYAFFYFIDSPIRQAAQKFAFLGLILILKTSALERLRVGERSPVHILEASKK